MEVILFATVLLLVGFGVFGVVLLARRGRQVQEVERQRRIARAAQDRVDAEREDAQEEQHPQIRQEARARARIAFPDLLDEQEAVGFDSAAADIKFTQAEYELIDDARGLATQQLEALASGNPTIAGFALHEAIATLEAPFEDEPGYDEVSLYLGEPERVVDCGAAGSIKLFTPAQVRIACQTAPKD